jgi:superfamily II DNA/RNA helicase
LRALIRSAEGLTNAIIFCNRKREVAALHRSLVRHGFSAIALHGDMDQGSRTAALEQFRKNDVTLLVASDVAARGLDIPAVSHIFNFDVPHHADDYVHRIGRTGRAGRSGTAVTIVTPAEQKSVTAIEKLIGQSISWMEPPPRAAVPELVERVPRAHAHQRPHRQKAAHKPARHEHRSDAKSRVTHLDEERARRAKSSHKSHQPNAAKSAPHKPAAHKPHAAHPQGGHLPAFLLRPTRVKA